MSEKKLDHGYAGDSKYRIEVFDDLGNLVGTFKHVFRADCQEFFSALKNEPDKYFPDCSIYVHRELAEKGEIND